MTIKVGRTVKDRLTGRIGLVVAIHHYAHGCLMDVDFGLDDHWLALDAWRLDPLPCGVVLRAIRTIARTAVAFVRSEASQPVTVKVALIAPYVYGLVTGIAVMLLRCRCS
jgi:hypothetical protein